MKKVRKANTIAEVINNNPKARKSRSKCKIGFFFFNWLRTCVSVNKKRTKEEGFNLDLRYISSRLIAIGFPADGVESIYRN
jgi:hypothetical protein